MTQTQANAATMTYYTARVVNVRRLTEHMSRVTLGGDGLSELVNPGPDASIKLFFPLVGQQRPVLPAVDGDNLLSWYRDYLAMPDDIRPPMRTYTIRAHRPERAQIDVDFALHDEAGPATRWILAARPGDEVAFLAPHALYAVPAEATWQLLIGDESALPAIASIVEDLPPGARTRAFVEVDGPGDELTLETQADLATSWVHRRGAPHGDRLLDTVRAASLPTGMPYAWIAGESGLVKFARRHMVRDRDVPKRVITFTGYWRIGTSEEDVGRENIRKIEAGESPVDED